MVNFGLASIDDITKISKKVGDDNSFTPDSLFMCGKQEDDILMWFAFRIEDGLVEIVDIDAEGKDENLLFFCGRSGLNALDLTGYRNIISKNEKIKEILDKLGFKKEGEVFYLAITDDYFKAGCCKNT